MTRKLLETNFRLQIYGEYGDWMHALYDAHVQPTLVSQYKSVKGSTGFSHRYSQHCVMSASNPKLKADHRQQGPAYA